ncbi:hypothetical protein [Phyllobacterium zundukense]
MVCSFFLLETLENSS